MKLTIKFENKNITINLNSPIRVKELLHGLSKKLNLQKQLKVSLLNPNTNNCYDEQDLISISEDFEVILFTTVQFKQVKVIKSQEKLEDLIKFCTDAKNTLKPNKFSYKGYSYKYNQSKPAVPENEFDYFKEIILNSTSSNRSIRSKLSELMFKFESLKDATATQGNQNSNDNPKPQAQIPQVKQVLTDGVKILNSFFANSGNSSIPDNPIPQIPTQTSASANVEVDKMPELDMLEKITNKITASYRKTEKVEPNPEKLKELLCMGFEDEKCRKALIISNNKIEHATELLLGGSDFELYDTINNNQYNDLYVDKYNKSIPVTKVTQVTSSIRKNYFYNITIEENMKLEEQNNIISIQEYVF